MPSIADRAAAMFKPITDIGRLLALYFITGRRKRQEPIVDRAGLRQFLQTRASFVAQTSLYGYMRTRAGVRYPELFHDDTFIEMLNVSKWQIWLACLSDLSVFTGGLLVQRVPGARDKTAQLMQQLVSDILAETSQPAEAGPAFAENANAVRTRIALTNWTAITDDEGSFTASPDALVRWSPIVATLKDLDEPIVRNSIRFRWQQVRRDLREYLDAEAVLSDSS